MWEQIRANRIRSFGLITFLAILLVVLGVLIGMSVHPDGALVGAAFALIAWLILWLVALFQGREILLSSAGAVEIGHKDFPRLFNVVEEMTIAAGLPKPPRVYIIDCDAPNAFAAGTPDNCAIAVTTGLLISLNRDELQGVIAHEVGHISNQDSSFMTHAGVMVIAIAIISNVFLRGFRTIGAGQRRGGSRRGGGGVAVIILLALVFAILAPVLARLLYFACSRRREYLADAMSAQFTRYPEGLASALVKISGSLDKMANVESAMAPMYIVNPLEASAAEGLFSTHPPVEKRVRVLRSMAGGASYANYESAYAKLEGRRLMSQATVAERGATSLRPASTEPEPDPMKNARDVVDTLHKLNGYLFLSCSCGLKIKVPPLFKQPDIHCPACGGTQIIPQEIRKTLMAGVVATLLGRGKHDDVPTRKDDVPLSLKYTSGKWQKVNCSCGNGIEISPAFEGTRGSCPVCGRAILFERSVDVS